MIRPANIAIVLVGGALLGVMMQTAPDYNSVVQPFRSHLATGETGEARSFRARFTGARLAERIAFRRFGRDLVRDTDGVFLIAEIEAEATVASQQIGATWRGASGRDYALSRRAQGIPTGLDSRWFQPGLTDRAIAVFELPEDEIAGGEMVLTNSFNAVFDSALHLAPPPLPADKLPLVRIDP
ncbi:hypothetical protein ATN84_22575 [Paramesorhizobium deserti]|uniref:Uncharacterized protein n=1 Tax=Paramesorhizobium deserti TaxID=1494590 RepID=A0A135HNK4_9HYPH|nr:hypothetical protein [Paramesorhizobium deserti]KXF74683.1 hypothetical protein ATN84_22575 [Paramesorhizobium deserti]